MDQTQISVKKKLSERENIAKTDSSNIKLP
jgi:hypothetical protein